MSSKISELPALATPQPTDVLPIVDNSGAPTNKKITIANLLRDAIVYSIALG